MNKIIKTKLDNLKGSRFEVLDEFFVLDLLNSDVWLAGGALRTLFRKGDDKINDYDIFFRDLSKVDEIREKLVKAGADLIFECPEGKLFTYKFADEGYVDIDDYRSGMKIQLITERQYADPEGVIRLFDFHACMGITDGEYLYFHTGLVKSLYSRNLTLNTLTYPVATLKRIVKYAKKGYKIHQIAFDFVDFMAKSFDLGQKFSADELRFYID